MGLKDKDNLRDISKTNEYSTISKYFDESKCNSCNLIGCVSEICKNSEAKTFEEWSTYYTLKTPAENIAEAINRLKNTLILNNLNFTDDTIEKCFWAFVLWKTWVGNEMEITAKERIEKQFPCDFATGKMDSKYAVDILLKQKKMVILGVQIKPDTYLYTAQKFNTEKNNRFQKDYGTEVAYIYYDSTTRSFEKDAFNEFFKKRAEAVRILMDTYKFMHYFNSNDILPIERNACLRVIEGRMNIQMFFRLLNGDYPEKGYKYMKKIHQLLPVFRKIYRTYHQ